MWRWIKRQANLLHRREKCVSSKHRGIDAVYLLFLVFIIFLRFVSIDASILSYACTTLHEDFILLCLYRPASRLSIGFSLTKNKKKVTALDLAPEVPTSVTCLRVTEGKLASSSFHATAQHRWGPALGVAVQWLRPPHTHPPHLASTPVVERGNAGSCTRTPITCAAARPAYAWWPRSGPAPRAEPGRLAVPVRGNQLPLEARVLQVRRTGPASAARVRRPSLPGEDPHDWACACGQMNFRGSVVCHKCAAKPVPPGQETQLWTCPACKGINRDHRKTCFKCGAISPNFTLAKPQVPGQSGGNDSQSQSQRQRLSEIEREREGGPHHQMHLHLHRALGWKPRQTKTNTHASKYIYMRTRTNHTNAVVWPCRCLAFGNTNKMSNTMIPFFFYLSIFPLYSLYTCTPPPYEISIVVIPDD
eukprot:gene9577-6732_t